MTNKAQQINLLTYERHWVSSKHEWLTALRWRFHYNTRAHLLLFRKAMRLLDEPCENKRVLDIGFGAGHALFSLPISNAIYGVDIAEESVRRATDKARALGYRDYRFELARPDDAVPFPDASMDLVVASHIIEHLEDDVGMLKEIHRLLAPGGTAIIIMPIDLFGDAILPAEALIHEGYVAGTDTHVRRYNRATFAHTIESVGLSVAHVLPWDAYYDLLSRIDHNLRMPLRRWIPLLDRVISLVLNVSLCSLPERVLDLGDRYLSRRAFRPRQAAFVCRVAPDR